jgi:hypothetical protein
MAYLMTLSVAQSIQRRMAKWFVNVELAGKWKDELVRNLLGFVWTD